MGPATGVEGGRRVVVDRSPRSGVRSRLARLAARGAATALDGWTVLSNALGLRPLLRRSLSDVPARPAGPVLSRTTSFLFRWLVLLRWWRGDNRAGARVATRYVRRARTELETLGCREARAEPVPAADPSGTAPGRLARDLRRAPRPLVFRGWHRPQRDWSLAELIRDVGSTPVLMRWGDGFEWRPLRDLMDRDDAYVANSEQLLIEHPGLLSALRPARSPGRWLGGVPYAVQLFLGARAGTGLTFHCANNWNFFTMLHGRKRWTFVDPAHSYFMYPWITRDGAYVASILHHPEIDPAVWDLHRAAPRLEVTLEPGDVLVSPPWWWHRVENLDEETVGASSRWSVPWAAETNRLFSFAQVFSPGLRMATRDVLGHLIEGGASLSERYARSAAGPTRIERVAHTREQLLPGEVGARAWGGLVPEPRSTTTVLGGPDESVSQRATARRV